MKVPRIRFSLVAWLICGRVVLAQDAVTTADEQIDDFLDLDDDAVVVEADIQYPTEVDSDAGLGSASRDVSETETPTSNDSAIDQNSDAPPAEGIRVKTNLESMSIDELQAICQKRGFALEGDNLLHADYVEAAKRCLSLEDEINAIIAENPDLAAELENEIERMAQEKGRLEKERDALLAEKEALEAKLGASGIDVDDLTKSGNTASSLSSDALPYDPTSSIDVFRHSTGLLWERVGADMRLVGKALQVVVFHPGCRVLSFVWRYARPTVENGVKKIMLLSEDVLEQESLRRVRDITSRQIQSISHFLSTRAVPVLVAVRSKLGEAAILLNQQDPICKVTAIVGAVVGPPCEGLIEGWRSAKPGLNDAGTNVTAWWLRLKSESHQS